jgi:xanthine dehydrogenase accessory factor
MKSLTQILQRACTERTRLWALATLVRTHGSTYRKAGARLLVDASGETIGVLSGGCLEEEIAKHGQSVIETGEPALLHFDTRRLLGCDGRLEIFVERIPPGGTAGNILIEIAVHLAERRTCRVRTKFAGTDKGSTIVAPNALIAEADDTFIHTIPLPIRLVLFGAGPEIAPLQALAAPLGWIIDTFTHPSDLPDDFRADDQTAGIIMTHNFGRDLAALDRLLPLRLPYLGLLGPRKRHAQLLAHYAELRDLDPSWIGPLHAPAGLDIGSEAPEEIALSILSEVAAVLAGRTAGFLRDRAMAVHALPPSVLLQRGENAA